MKDGFDIVKDVRGLINIPAVTSQITGKIWPDVRPNGSANSDIVVNSIGITNTQQQVGFANLNIYAPNISQVINGHTQQFPNHAELNRLTKLISPYLEAQYRDTFYTDIEDPGTLLQDTDGSWFVSIQVQYHSIQENYQNI